LFVSRGGGKQRGSSPATSIFNLVNNVAGAGLLTLSAGMAGGVGSGPAAIIGVALGAMSAYTFAAVGTCCEALKVKDFRGLWCKTIGESSAFAIDAAISVMCLSACVIYSGIIADVVTSLVATAGLGNPGRAVNLGLVTTGVLLPLCLLKSLAALGFTSLLGLGAIIYTALFIFVRALDGTYASPNGVFYNALLSEGPRASGLLPSFEMASRWGVSSKAFVLASNLGLAYIAHYNAPRYYSELDRKTPEKFRGVVWTGFGVLATLYVGVMLAGHSIFGDNCQSSILNNFAGNDPLAVGGRIATLVSIIFGYPLAFVGLLDSLKGACASVSGGKGPLGALSNPHPPAWLDNGLRVALLALATVTALVVEDIGLVVGLTGSLVGACIVYIAPSIISLNARAYALKKGGVGREAKVHKMLGGGVDQWICRALVPLGIAIGGIGAKETITAYFGPF
jgi:amino acid permease